MQKIYPQNQISEQAVLGMILLDNERIEKIPFLKEIHFFIHLHQIIFSKIKLLIEKNYVVSQDLLHNELQHNSDYIKNGGVKYLSALVMLSLTNLAIVPHARLILNLYKKRQLIQIAQRAILDAEDESIAIEVDDLLQLIQQKLFKLNSDCSLTKEFKPLHELCEITIQNISSKEHQDKFKLHTNYTDLDNILIHLTAPDLIVVAARPSMGKTAFALNLTFNIAKNLAQNEATQNETVLFFSLEMSEHQIAERLLCIGTGIDSYSLKNNKITELNFNKLKYFLNTDAKLNVYIDDNPALTIHDIKSKAKKLKMQKGLKIILIDYLQLIKNVENGINRNYEIGEITQGLKALAKELDIVIIVLSQLSRAVEQREDKKPMLSDLRDSGSIEQDADIVMFLYREDYYTQKPENTATLIVAKHRNGKTGTVNLNYYPSCFTFANQDKRPYAK